MKKCPQCKSTYGDDTLSFCLQDGAPLSAAYDSEPTLVLGADDSTVQRTNANYSPEMLTATKVGESRQTASSIQELGSNKISPHLIYAFAGLFVVGLLVTTFVWWINRGDYQVANPPANNILQDSAPAPIVTPAEITAEPTPFRAKLTTPKGEVQHSGRGPYYNNYGNTLEVGVAYKYPDNLAVYVYDGQFLQQIESEQAFLDFYGCGNLLGRILQCAPIYEIPSFVTATMFKRSVQTITRQNNVPTTQELQETLLKEAQRITDEAKKR